MSYWGGYYWGGGSGGGGGSGPSFPVLSSATTEELLRDTIIAVIAGLDPTLLSGDRFIPYRNEGVGDFVEWADANPAGAFRRFQVRAVGETLPPAVSNTDIELLTVTFQILIAYPQNARYGEHAALDRDDVRKADEQQIWNYGVGHAAGGNFSGKATWTPGGLIAGQPERGAACDFATITVILTYYKQQR